MIEGIGEDERLHRRVIHRAHPGQAAARVDASVLHHVCGQVQRRAQPPEAKTVPKSKKSNEKPGSMISNAGTGIERKASGSSWAVPAVPRSVASA